MGSDHFVELKDVPDIYTDSGSDSSDESIKALLTSKSSRAPSTDGESVKSTPSKNLSKQVDKTIKPKKEKSEKNENSPKPKKTPAKRDLEKSSEPKPKKVKQSKPKTPKETEKQKDLTEGVPEEVKETTKKEESEKAPKSPKVKSVPASKPESTDSSQKEVTETPKKKKSKPKTPKVTTPQDSEKDLPKDVSDKEQEKVEKPKETPKRKKDLEKESSPKPKKPRASKPKKTNEVTEVVDEKAKEDEKKEKLEEVKEKIEETIKKQEKEDESDKELEGTMKVLKKLSNQEVFSSLSKRKVDDVPMGELKAKLLTLSESESETSETSSESDSDSSESKSDSELDDVLIKPKLPSVKFDIKEDESEESDLEDQEEDEEEEEQFTPKSKLTTKEEIPVVSSEQFINKERLHKTQKTVLDIPAGCEIYCGNLPVNITEEELRELFEECGAITRINKLNKKGIAFITFSNEESAQKASEYNNSPYKGQLLNINITTNRPLKKEFKKFGKEGTWGKNKQGEGENNPTNEVCIRNLNFNSTEEGLRELFGECGQVTRCYLPKFQDSGKPMGICFITFTTVEGAKRAVEYDRTEIDGRTVSIQYAQPRGNRSGMRGRGLKGRFTNSNSRVSTLSRPLGNNSNKTNGSFKEKKGNINNGNKCDQGLTSVGFVGEESKPKSIIFEDSDSE